MEATGHAGPSLPGLDVRHGPVRAVPMRWHVGGEGPPLVLVHGLGGAAANWGPMAAVLARRFRVLVPDLPGHGGSEALPAACGLASFADRVALVAEREGFGPALVAGHSLGGAIAVRLALRRPAQVRGLALFAAAGLLAFPRWRRVGMAASRLLAPCEVWLARNAAEVARRPRLRRLAFGGWGAAHPAGMSPAAVTGFLEAAMLTDDTRSARLAMIEERSREELAKVAVPSLVVWGARDRLVPLEVGFEYARRLHAPIRVLPAAGHLVIGEYPSQCARLVDELADLAA
jgi:pimeloyl-ACP methyl ester carboxylesterase